MKFEPAKILPMVAACAAIAQRSMKANAIAVQGKAELFGATDQESTLVSARFDVAQDWVLVPASKLLSALKSIGSAEADWELLPESVTITAKGVRYSLPIIPKGDFPSLDAIGAEDSESRKRYGVQAAPLIEAIETVAPCVATQSGCNRWAKAGRRQVSGRRRAGIFGGDSGQAWPDSPGDLWRRRGDDDALHWDKYGPLLWK
jgi:hypothetical protein